MKKLNFVFFNDPKQLKFEVYDWDKMSKDDFLADAILRISDYFNNGSPGFNGKLKLQNTKKGEIEVLVQCRKLLPIELEVRGNSLYQQLETQKNNIIQTNEQIRQLSDENNILTQDNKQRVHHIEELTNERNQSNMQVDQLRNISENLNKAIEVHKTEKNTTR